MAESLAISEIFNIKEWPDLEIWFKVIENGAITEHIQLSVGQPL